MATRHVRIWNLDHKNESALFRSIIMHSIPNDFQNGDSCYQGIMPKNTTNPAISLVAYNIIPLLIGQPALAPITSVMYHSDEGTRPLRGTVTNGLLNPT